MSPNTIYNLKADHQSNFWELFTEGEIAPIQVELGKKQADGWIPFNKRTLHFGSGVHGIAQYRSVIRSRRKRKRKGQREKG